MIVIWRNEQNSRRNGFNIKKNELNAEGNFNGRVLNFIR